MLLALIFLICVASSEIRLISLFMGILDKLIGGFVGLQSMGRRLIKLSS